MIGKLRGDVVESVGVDCRGLDGFAESILWKIYELTNKQKSIV